MNNEHLEGVVCRSPHHTPYGHRRFAAGADARAGARSPLSRRLAPLLAFALPSVAPPCSARLAPPWGGLRPWSGRFAPRPGSRCPSLALRCARGFNVVCSRIAFGAVALLASRSRSAPKARSPVAPSRVAAPARPARLPRRSAARSLSLPLRPLAVARRPAGPLLAPRARLGVPLAFRSAALAAFARASGVAPPRRRRLNGAPAVALPSFALLFPLRGRPGLRRFALLPSASACFGKLAGLRPLAHKASFAMSPASPSCGSCEPFHSRISSAGRQLVRKCVKHRDFRSVVLECFLHSLQIAISMHQPDGVRLAHRMRAEVRCKAARFLRPLDVCPDRLPGSVLHRVLG